MFNSVLPFFLSFFSFFSIMLSYFFFSLSLTFSLYVCLSVSLSLSHTHTHSLSQSLPILSFFPFLIFFLSFSFFLIYSLFCSEGSSQKALDVIGSPRYMNTKELAQQPFHWRRDANKKVSDWRELFILFFFEKIIYHEKQIEGKSVITITFISKIHDYNELYDVIKYKFQHKCSRSRMFPVHYNRARLHVQETFFSLYNSTFDEMKTRQEIK